MSTRRILVTSALPYANGHIHIGHLVEYIQTDIWARFQRLRGQRCLYVCADDTHGTAIMLRARQEGRDEEAVIADMAEAHQRDFADFRIDFDNYGSTNNPSNRRWCETIWRGLRRQGMVFSQEVERLFDERVGTFLADRFVKGTCPHCGAPDQYGDSCDKCQATYAATELIEPRSTLSDAPPVRRRSDQLFVAIENLHDFLTGWTQSGEHLQPETANYLRGHFLGEPLRDWDVSRPAPYFGFEIPDAPGNYWYVWFDAPIGYISSLQDWCDAHAIDREAWWSTRGEVTSEIHHFIGRDIVYFHTLFWPAMLESAGLQLPDKVHVHGFLTVNGEKMSKTKGTFITARTYLDHLDPSYLRYYYAARLNGRDEDLDLNLEDFVDKVNADLVGKVVNLASRTARFVADVGLANDYPDDDGLFAAGAAEAEAIAADYEACNYAAAMRRIMAAADRANEYVERMEPWRLRKDPAEADTLQRVCTVALNCFRQLAIYLAPVLPRLATQTGELLGEKITNWDQAQAPLLGTPVATFKHLLTRVDPAMVAAMVAASTDTARETAAASAATSLGPPDLGERIDFDAFCRVDLRVARIAAAAEVDGADSLLALNLDLGKLGTRTVFAGIKAAYTPDDLAGRLVVCVANLAPRTMRFGTSDGMILAAGDGAHIRLIVPEEGSQPGQRIR